MCTGEQSYLLAPRTAPARQGQWERTRHVLTLATEVPLRREKDRAEMVRAEKGAGARKMNI